MCKEVALLPSTKRGSACIKEDKLVSTEIILV